MEITFRTHGLTGHLRFGAPDLEGWMTCDVLAQAPGITADYRCSIQRPELQHLRGQLAAAIKGQRHVNFEAMELGIRIKLDINDMGHVRGVYEFRSDSAGPCLSGSFDADQTYLRPWLDEVDEVLACAV